jgi:hypothetical protein
LLTRLQCLRLFIGRTLEVHAKPKNGDEDAGYAGGNVLRRLQALVARSCWTLALLLVTSAMIAVQSMN